MLNAKKKKMQLTSYDSKIYRIINS